MADSIVDALSRVNQRPLSLEGTASGQWVLIDFGDVVAHVFRQDTRSHYALERLWSDARLIPIPDKDTAPTPEAKERLTRKTRS